MYSFDLIYVQVDLIYLTLNLIYQILTIYLKTDFCPIWRVIAAFYLPLRLRVVHFRRGAVFDDAVCTEIKVRQLQKNYAGVLRKCSLQLCKNN